MEKMKLLIRGAGGHGRVVQEIATACGYDTTFLDDSSESAIGTIDDMEKYSAEYEYCFVAIGNGELRKKLMERAEKSFSIPTLIHPSAIVSKSAVIEEGVVVEAGALINTGAVIHKGAIIGLGAVVDHDAVVGSFSHVDAGAVVESGAIAVGKVMAGTIVRKKNNGPVNWIGEMPVAEKAWAEEYKKQTGREPSFD